jgi:hypothetical protein
MKARNGSLGVLSAAIVLGGWLTLSHAADPPPASGGMVIYQDPATGELMVPPPGAIPPPADGLRERAAAPVEVPGTTPAGGWKMNVQRRFMYRMHATSGSDGTVTTECVPGGPGGTE